jgi:hypothetical protein
MSLASTPHYVEEFAQRPGPVTAIRGVVFQSDGRSVVGRMFIRPFEAFDRWMVGVLPRPGEQSLAMHAGIHVVIGDQQEYVAEQLVGSFYLNFRNGLNWTPYDQFKARDRGGWDVTVPATAFRGIHSSAVEQTLQRLNGIVGHPFLGEDCTAFVERAFGCRRMFADSPLLRWLGIGMRIGDPALPLLKPDALPDEPARSSMQFDKIKDLPDALAGAESPNGQLWAHRLAALALVGGAGALASRAYSSSSRKSTPISSTARRFLR